MKDPGAGFLDVAYFNSACFYRYMRIDFALLEKTLGDHDLAVKTVEGFMRAAEAAIPSGKQNSHAQFTRPSFMLAVLRPDGSDGWNLVNAFAQPIGVAENDEQGLIKKSVHALEDKFDHHCKFYGEGAVNTIAVALPDGTITQSDLSKRLADAIKSMDEWVKTMTDGLGK
jgi:CRISPR system Cascade subunit CasC